MSSVILSLTPIVFVALGQSQPVPQNSPTSWIPRQDQRLEPRTINGKTLAILTIDANGKVMGCRIERSSGSTILDEAVCSRSRENAIFHPARASDGSPVDGEYPVSVVWGHHPIDIQPFVAKTVYQLENGKAVSCYLQHEDGTVQDASLNDATHAGCNPPKDILLKAFGKRYVEADQLIIRSMILAGDGQVDELSGAGERVVLKDSVIEIGPDGKPLACRSRVPNKRPTLSLDDCLGYETGRSFTGLRTFVSAIDWTIRYPAQGRTD